MTTSPELLDTYLAGVFDGEGSVSMSLTKAGYLSVAVRVVMCDRAPVALFYERFGGYFYDGQHCTPHGRKIYSWSLYSGDTVEALEMFTQRCLVKNVVAGYALPCAKSMRDNPTRGVLSQAEKAARIAAAEAIARINKPVGLRRVLDPATVAEYMKPKTSGGGRAVRFEDGRTFPSLSAAARELGVTVSAVRHAKRNKRRVRGILVEAA